MNSDFRGGGKEGLLGLPSRLVHSAPDAQANRIRRSPEFAMDAALAALPSHHPGWHARCESRFLMKPDVYAKMAGKGFILLLGVEVIEEWKDGCRIRSEQRFPFLQSISYYVIDGESLVAIRLGHADGEGPFDYIASKDLSDARPLEDPELQIR